MKHIFTLIAAFTISIANAQWADVGGGVNGSTHVISTWNNMLIVGGSFNGPCGRITGWNGVAWNCFGSGVGIVARDAVSWNNNLVVCGDFWNVNQPCSGCNGIAMWDGTSWLPLGTGFNNDVLCMTVWNGDLVAAGDFTTADGNPVSRIARWTGSAWVPIGGLSDFDNDIRCLAVYNGELWAGGDFNNVGGNTPADGLVKWNGTAWVGGNSGVDVIGGVDSTVRCFYVDQQTNQLYMGGHFLQLNGDNNCAGVAVYNGNAWSPLGTGVNSYVRALTKYNGTIIVGGDFNTAGPITANKIARWNPATSTWAAMGTGMNDYVKGLDVWQGKLYAGGPFTTADGLPRSGVAEWYEAPAVPPVAAFTASATNVCLGQCINFTDNSTNTPTSWNWTFNGANPATSTLQNPMVICYNTPGTYNVTLQACNSYGCNTTATAIVVSTQATPTVTLSSAPSATICAGSSTTLSASGASTYSWAPATGLSATTGNTVIASPTATITYTITGSNGSCASTQTITVTVNASPTVAVTPTSMNICPLGSTPLAASGATSYSWLPTSGLSSSTGPNVTASPSASTTYTVTGTAANGCTSTATTSITVGASTPLPLVEGFESLPFVPTLWTTVNGGSDGLVWTRATNAGGFGNSTNCATFQNFGAAAAGTIDEMRTMTLNLNSLSSAQLTFDVAYARRNSGTPDTMSVRVSTDCGATWTTVFTKGGSTLSTAPNTNSSFLPTAAQWRNEVVSLTPFIGNGSVMLSFRNHCRNSNNLYVDNINITGVTTNPPTAAFSLSAFSMCAGSCVSVTDATSGLPTSWNWSFAGGNPSSSTQQNPGSVCYATSGTYTIQLISCNANGCDTTFQSIIVSGPVVATASTNNVSCFGGNDGMATAVPAGGTAPYTYNWSPIGGTSATATSLPAGVYTCMVADVYGCGTTITVTITEPAPIAATTTYTNVACNGDADGAIDLSVSGGAGSFTFDWNSGAYTTEDISALGAGNYNVIITDANGCTTAQVVTITQPPALTSSITTSNDPSVCGGSDGAVNISVGGGTSPYTYLWSNGATTQDILGVPAGAYSCTVTDNNGCTTLLNAILNDPFAPTVTNSIPEDTVCQSTTNPFALTGGNPAGGTYAGPGVSGGMFDPMLANIGANVITYSYTDINNCTGIASDTVYVDICLGVDIPSGNVLFTLYPNPNGGSFFLATNENGVVTITDASGRLVETRVANTSLMQFTIDAAGMYFVTFTDPNGIVVTKPVVITE
jgi:PKD repeat protein